jgi:serine/threonine protein kinase
MEPLTADDPRQVSVFRLQSRLGAGGMGRVYLATSPGGRAVAVKVVHPELARDPEFMRRFRHEVTAAEAVSGVYTAPVVGAGPDDSPPWLATAYVPGPSLAELVAGGGPLPEAAVWRLAGGLVEALQAIHGRGLVHRDLKPGNILIAADGPRVIDFGISRALHGIALTTARATSSRSAACSPSPPRARPRSTAVTCCRSSTGSCTPSRTSARFRPRSGT